jgi:hypothetical protein
MHITDILGQTGGLQSIARELGVSEGDVQNGATALLPALASGFHEQAQQPDGIDRLDKVVGRLGGGELLDNVVSPQPTDVGRGNSLLSHIFGSPDVSRSVAQNAAQQSGLDASLLKRMLPMLAMLLAGHMARQRGGLGAALGGLAGLGGMGGLGGLAGMLGGRR